MLEQWLQIRLRGTYDDIRQYFERAGNTARQEILLAAIVFVKRRSRHSGSCNDFSHGDFIVLPRPNELGKRPQYRSFCRLCAQSNDFERLSGRRASLSLSFT
jgi:hypothetical protein